MPCKTSTFLHKFNLEHLLIYLFIFGALVSNMLLFAQHFSAYSILKTVSHNKDKRDHLITSVMQQKHPIREHNNKKQRSAVRYILKQNVSHRSAQTNENALLPWLRKMTSEAPFETKIYLYQNDERNSRDICQTRWGDGRARPPVELGQ